MLSGELGVLHGGTGLRGQPRPLGSLCRWSARSWPSCVTQPWSALVCVTDGHDEVAGRQASGRDAGGSACPACGDRGRPAPGSLPRRRLRRGLWGGRKEVCSSWVSVRWPFPLRTQENRGGRRRQCARLALSAGFNAEPRSKTQHGPRALHKEHRLLGHTEALANGAVAGRSAPGGGRAPVGKTPCLGGPS